MVSAQVRELITKCFIIPQRVVSALMAFSATALAYMLRISLSYAITQMVPQPHAHENGTIAFNPDVCPPFEDETNTNHTNTTPVSTSIEIYDWDQALQGLILSSFYWGYIVTHIPAGILSAKIGGKYTLFLGVATATICTLITPFAIRNGGSDYLIILRIIVGMGEGLIFPSCSTLLAAWTPKKERSIASTVVYSGAMVGSIFGSFLSGLLISNYGWTSVFYWFGGVSVIWCIVFWLICYNNPESHPFITEREKIFLKRELGELKRRDDLPPTPWCAMLTSPPMLALIAAQVGHNWGIFIIINDLPKYMNDVLRFSIKKNGLYTSVPYAVLWIVALCTGFSSDILIKRKTLGITNSRKLFTSIAAFGPAIFIIVASYCGCDRITVVAMFTLGMGFMGTFYSGFKANILDLAPNYAGVIMGIANGLGGLAGIIGPYIVGLLTPNSYLTEWRIVFWITFAILVITTIIFDVFASGEVQPWNNPQTIQTAEPEASKANNNSLANNGNSTQFSQKPI